MRHNIFISEQNSISNRWTIFEENGKSGWLYLTEPNNEYPVGDCWVYNQIASPKEIMKLRNCPPPATTEYAKPNASNTTISSDAIKFRWSENGNDVAILINDIPVGYILNNYKRGFSRNLFKAGPWGNMFDDNLYSNYFEY